MLHKLETYLLIRGKTFWDVQEISTVVETIHSGHSFVCQFKNCGFCCTAQWQKVWLANWWNYKYAVWVCVLYNRKSNVVYIVYSFRLYVLLCKTNSMLYQQAWLYNCQQPGRPIYCLANILGLYILHCVVHPLLCTYCLYPANCWRYWPECQSFTNKGKERKMTLKCMKSWFDLLFWLVTEALPVTWSMTLTCMQSISHCLIRIWLVKIYIFIT